MADTAASRGTIRNRAFPARRLLDRSGTHAEGDDNWLITLSDLLCLLLVVFIAIFALSHKGREAKTDPAAAAPAVPQPASTVSQEIRAEVIAGIARLELDDDVSVTSTDREVIVTLRERATFSSGQADILEESRPILDHIAGVLIRHPSYLVDIEGHTDNVPISTSLYPSNWELSVARATSVLKYLISRHRLDPSRFTVKGNADLRPKVSNDTPENRAGNRRVEVRLREKES